MPKKISKKSGSRKYRLKKSKVSSYRKKKYMKKRHSSTRMMIYSNPLSALATNGFQLGAFTLLNNGPFNALLLFPNGGIPEGVQEGTRIGKHVYCHYFQLDYTIQPQPALNVQEIEGLDTALGFPWVRTFWLESTKGQYGTQGATMVANITAAFPNNPIYGVVTQRWMMDPRPENFDPLVNGFFCKKAKAHRMEQVAVTAGGVVIPYNTGGNMCAHGKYTFRNRLLKFDTDAHVIPDTPLPIIAFMNYCPNIMLVNYTYKMVYSIV